MCYHTSVKAPPAKLKETFSLPMIDEELWKPHYHANGFAHPLLPVVANDDHRAIFMFKWGLIPSWVKSPEDAAKLANQTLNAKSETIFEKASFRDSIIKRRCVIPVDGFFEWKHEGKVKVPYFIHPKENPFFLLAGIYSHWKNPFGGNETTFSIITTEANELMASIHNTKKRMPVMIDAKNIDAWIDPGLNNNSIIELMQGCDDRDMAAYTISKDIGNPKVNSDIPTITNPVQHTLF